MVPSQRAIKINARGHLEIGGCDAVELAWEFGTPLYVLDETCVRKKCREYVDSLKRKGQKAEVVYAAKALINLAVCRIIAGEGLGLDVVSGGELYTALKAGFPPARIYFHGNNKSKAELTFALQAEVGRTVVDNFYELLLLGELANRFQKKVAILLRVAPGIEAHTHAYIQTGQEDSKFGFDLVSGQAKEAVKICLTHPSLELKGLHCHVGSQISSLEPFQKAAAVMLALLAEIKKEFNVVLPEVDLGGGLGIAYTAADNPPSIDAYVAAVTATVQENARKYSLPVPKIILEPGRSIVGEAGTTLYTVGSIKEIPEVRKYVAVDGGMADNIRPALYGARYEGILANKANATPTEVVSIAGKCCESGDLLISDLPLPPPEPGDILAIFCTGAYGYTMASNYNRLGRPAMVLVREGKAELIVSRETYADLLAHDLIPPQLQEKVSQTRLSEKAL